MKKKRQWIPVLILAVLCLVGLGVFLLSRGNYEKMTGIRRYITSLVRQDEILNTDYIGTVSTEHWSKDDPYRLEDTVILMKDPEHDFVIMNVTDIHISDYWLDSVLAIRTFAQIRRLVKELQPDLITLSGDIVWEVMERDDSTIYSMHRVTEFMDSLKIPWAMVFGNHDGKGNCDLNYLADIMAESEYSLMKKGDPAFGVGNYVINICEEQSGEQLPVHSLILMDSHNGQIPAEQIDWYAWAARGICEIGGKDVPSTLIMHIPLPEYETAYHEAWDVASESWKDGYGAFGANHDDFNWINDEEEKPITAFFERIKEIGTTKNVLCGHDHRNCASIVYEGVRLTYSLRLGKGAYFDFDMQGVTTLTINSQGDVLTEHHYMYPYDIKNP
ncbi:MAG: metallophosphoesterase [Firmicutes bacterium]|nr:metallophosphoesterase [Lachnospiraceae bacterium]MBQ7060130.1 metallophosphoesterase [Bacillota bacterium]